MFIKLAKYITCAAALLAIILSPALDVFPAGKKKIHLSSIGSRFALQGDFYASCSLEPVYLELEFEPAMIRYVHPTNKGIYVAKLTVGLSTFTGKRICNIEKRGCDRKWNVIADSTLYSLEREIKTGESITLDPVAVRIPIDNSMDLSKCWLTILILDMPAGYKPDEHSIPGYGISVVNSKHGIFKK